MAIISLEIFALIRLYNGLFKFITIKFAINLNSNAKFYKNKPEKCTDLNQIMRLQILIILENLRS